MATSYMTQEQATKLSNELKGQGWDAYVHPYCGAYEVIVSGRAK